MYKKSKITEMQCIPQSVHTVQSQDSVKQCDCLGGRWQGEKQFLWVGWSWSAGFCIFCQRAAGQKVCDKGCVGSRVIMQTLK